MGFTIWYLIGLVSGVVFCKVATKAFRVKDIVPCLLFSLFGPIVTFIFSFYLLIVSAEHLDKKLIKNKDKKIF